MTTRSRKSAPAQQIVSDFSPETLDQIFDDFEGIITTNPFATVEETLFQIDLQVDGAELDLTLDANNTSANGDFDTMVEEVLTEDNFELFPESDEETDIDDIFAV